MEKLKDVKLTFSHHSRPNVSQKCLLSLRSPNSFPHFPVIISLFWKESSCVSNSGTLKPKAFKPGGLPRVQGHTDL